VFSGTANEIGGSAAAAAVARGADVADAGVATSVAGPTSAIEVATAMNPTQALRSPGIPTLPLAPRVQEDRQRRDETESSRDLSAHHRAMSCVIIANCA
jgi:hypothetical protein